LGSIVSQTLSAALAHNQLSAQQIIDPGPILLLFSDILPYIIDAFAVFLLYLGRKEVLHHNERKEALYLPSQ
jgi:hypothetical protein